jgi:hypothetical protein
VLAVDREPKSLQQRPRLEEHLLELRLRLLIIHDSTTDKARSKGAKEAAPTHNEAVWQARAIILVALADIHDPNAT